MSQIDLEGKLRLVNPRDFRFAPENYQVPKNWWDRLREWVLSWWPLM